jgi:O-antigen ligase
MSPTFDMRDSDIRMQYLLTVFVLVSLPLLMIFPKAAGWLAGLFTLIGAVSLIRHRDLKTTDWHFVAICVILPLAQLWNMLLMGWAPGFLARPTHLLWALMLYFLIGRYGIQRNALFYSACGAVFVAVGIAGYETFALGKERVFGLGERWNAVPFGNYSILFAFFCLCASLSAIGKPEKRRLFWVGLAGFAAGLSASLLSGTRSGWVAAPFLIALCFFFNTGLSRRLRIAWFAGIILLIAFVFAGSDAVNRRVDKASMEVSSWLAKPDSTAAQNTSIGLRLSMWRWGWNKFTEQPLTGIGLSAYKEQRETAVSTGEMPNVFNTLATLHNQIINTLALEGIPGLCALITFWVLAWRFYSSKLKTDDDEQHYYALIGLATVLGTALFSMTGSLFGSSASTKAFTLSLAFPAGALRYLMRKRAAA